MTGLGVLNTDLCMWAATATPQMVEDSVNLMGHPAVKAKPNSILTPPADAGLLARVNCWVDDNLILAGILVAAGYLILRKK